MILYHNAIYFRNKTNIKMYMMYYMNESNERVYTMAKVDPRGNPTFSAHPAR